MYNLNYQDNSISKQQKFSTYRVRRWMIKRQRGAVFGSALIILALLGSLMVLQNVAWHAQLQTRQQLTVMAQLDTIQFKASILYAKTQQTTFNLAGASVTVQDDNLRIRLGQTIYTRALLRHAPWKPYENTLK